MAAQQELLNEIAANLSASVAGGYSTASALNDLFEGYVWSIVIAAARDQGASIVYNDVFNNLVSR